MVKPTFSVEKYPLSRLAQRTKSRMQRNPLTTQRFRHASVNRLSGYRPRDRVVGIAAASGRRIGSWVMHRHPERRASGRIDRLVPLLLAETDSIACNKTVTIRKQKATYG